LIRPRNPILVATCEKVVPITAKHGTQTHQRWQAGEVVASLHVLNIAGAHANFFGKSFLSQIKPTQTSPTEVKETLHLPVAVGAAAV
jgi:hypothetical protein